MATMRVALCFLFIAFTTKGILATDAGMVVDVTGEPLLPHNSYYVVSAIWGAGGGGVNLVAARNNTCATDIIQEISDLNDGLPAKFIPKPRIGIVPESTDLLIKFDAVALCEDSSAVDSDWKVNEEDPSTGQRFLSVGRPPHHHQPINWFRIEKSGFANSYNIVYCPYHHKYCQHVGRYVDVDGLRRLALSENPFQVVFKRADDESLLRMRAS